MEGLTKYPRTLHLDWSPGATNDDKVMLDLGGFEGRHCVITEKRDGENTTMYKDYYHARSLDSNNHPSRNYVKGIWGSVKHNIPDGYRVCGENLYAKHSIGYDELESYFECFSIWDDWNRCLAWNSTCEWAELIGVKMVPVLWSGIFDMSVLRDFHKSLDLEKQEGFVIRRAEQFDFKDFGKYVAKWVRKGHVQTSEHWVTQEIIPNKLK